MEKNNLYKLYCVRMKIKSPISTWPKGDMVWGYLASYLFSSGQKNLAESFISQNDVPFIISSVYPAGKLPNPVCCHEISKFESKMAYADMKKLKKKKFIDASDYVEGVPVSTKECYMKETVSQHVAISRVSGSAMEGQLYSYDEKWISENGELDFYVVSYWDAEHVLSLMKSAFALGFGKRSSVGYGALDCLSVTEVRVKYPDSKHFMALGPFVKPSDCEIQDINSNIFVRFGKTGASNSSVDFPFKMPVILYDEGATFQKDDNRLFVGEVLTCMHSAMDIRQSGITPAIPIGD